MSAEHQEFIDAQPCTSGCLYCPWTYEGTVADGRREAEAHRIAAHPERAPGGELETAFALRKKRRKPWSKQEVVAAFARFEAEFDRKATQADIPLCPYLPSMNTVTKMAGSWAKAQDAAHAAVSASLSEEQEPATAKPPPAPAAPQRPAGRDGGTDPPPPTTELPGDRLRAALHELIDALLDYLPASR
jgi:hypothetical protein